MEVNIFEWIGMCSVLMLGLYLGNRSKKHPFYVHNVILTDNPNISIHSYFLFWEAFKIVIQRETK